MKLAQCDIWGTARMHSGAAAVFAVDALVVIHADDTSLTCCPG